MRVRVGTLLAAAFLCHSVSTFAVTRGSGEMLAGLDINITRLSIEDLLNLKITSVSGKPEAVPRAPAAVYEPTAEDVRRSGATSIPEVLRLVPGLQVAGIGANEWAVSSRGFNSRAANRLPALNFEQRSNLATEVEDGVYGRLLWRY